MLDNFFLNDGSEIWTRSFTGIVVESSSRTETEIYSTSTVGYTNVHGVTIGGGQRVNSSSTEIRTCWLRGAGGKEQEFTFTEDNLAYRTGNCLTIVWGGIQGLSSGEYLFISQHTTDKIWSAFENRTIKTATDIGLIKQSIIENFILSALFLSIVGIPIAFCLNAYLQSPRTKKARDFRTRAEAFFNEHKIEYANKAEVLIETSKSAA